MEWKILKNESCPNCGDDIEVFSAVPESHDHPNSTSVYDGEKVRCVSCKFESCISADEDGIQVQDGNIDEIEEG